MIYFEIPLALVKVTWRAVSVIRTVFIAFSFSASGLNESKMFFCLVHAHLNACLLCPSGYLPVNEPPR